MRRLQFPQKLVYKKFYVHEKKIYVDEIAASWGGGGGSIRNFEFFSDKCKMFFPSEIGLFLESMIILFGWKVGFSVVV